MTDTIKKARQRKAPGPFSDELLDHLLAQVSGKDAESLLGESGLIGQLKKQLAQRMLSAELNHHLSSEAATQGLGNHRNGSSTKTVITPPTVRWISTFHATGSPPSSPNSSPNISAGYQASMIT